MKCDLYISYSKQDVVFVNDLCSALEECRGKRDFDYHLGLKSEYDDVSDYIKRASESIAESKIMLFVASKNSIADNLCQEELLCATKHNVKVLCYYIDDSEPLSILSIPYYSTKTSVEQLVKNIAYDLETIGSTSSVKGVELSQDKRNTRSVGKMVAIILSLVIVASAVVFAASYVGKHFVESATPSGKDKKCPENYVENANGLNMKMIYVLGGTFMMGSNTGQRDERPVHSVTLDSYYIGETEVTQAQWRAVMGSNPSYFIGDNRPVENVSWYDALEFCKRVSELTGKRYMLPTEAQWEYAARGGCKEMGYRFSGSNYARDVAWYNFNSYAQTTSVKQKSPNELGLYDMSGNVYEWCRDWYGNYPSMELIEPKGATSGVYRVLRGGSWLYDDSYCRVTFRSNKMPDTRQSNRGFRVVCLI